MLHLILLVLCWIFVAVVISEEGNDPFEVLKGSVGLGIALWAVLEGFQWVFF